MTSSAGSPTRSHGPRVLPLLPCILRAVPPAILLLLAAPLAAQESGTRPGESSRPAARLRPPTRPRRRPLRHRPQLRHPEPHEPGRRPLRDPALDRALHAGRGWRGDPPPRNARAPRPHRPAVAPGHLRAVRAALLLARRALLHRCRAARRHPCQRPHVVPRWVTAGLPRAPRRRHAGLDRLAPRRLGPPGGRHPRDHHDRDVLARPGLRPVDHAAVDALRLADHAGRACRPGRAPAPARAAVRPDDPPHPRGGHPQPHHAVPAAGRPRRRPLRVLHAQPDRRAGSRAGPRARSGSRGCTRPSR